MKKCIDPFMVGKNIKQLRISRRMTQCELADLVGYSERNIRRIENEGTMNLEVVNTFACAFDVSALDILDEDVFLHKKSIGDLRHTILTLICYSYTCTPG